MNKIEFHLVAWRLNTNNDATTHTRSNTIIKAVRSHAKLSRCSICGKNNLLTSINKRVKNIEEEVNSTCFASKFLDIIDDKNINVLVVITKLCCGVS